MSRKIVIDDNFNAYPKSVILGNRGESLSREFEIVFPVLSHASLYLMRFKPPSGTVWEIQVDSGKMIVPAIVLSEVGEGFMQWIAMGGSGQYIAKSDMISYAVLESLETGIDPVPVPEETDEAINRINTARDFAIQAVYDAMNDILSQLAEVVDISEQAEVKEE